MPVPIEISPYINIQAKWFDGSAQLEYSLKWDMMDFERRKILLNSRSLELIWQARNDFDENWEIFSGIFYDNYAELVSLFSLEAFDNKQLQCSSKESSKINVFYSMPACYLQALHQAQLTWPTTTQDFFPYAHNP
ncbi:hypothetical protein GQX74_011168 [Glossina fuscipes]|nr:hypothetical protein GQX74_011168 [Glossina fuscipes]